MDSNHRSKLQQIYSLSPLATRESARSISSCIALTIRYYSITYSDWQELFLAITDEIKCALAAHFRARAVCSYDSKKKTASNAVFLGEGIFTMGYSKNYIMYWGVFTVIIIAWFPKEVCTNFTKVHVRFCAMCTT